MHHGMFDDTAARDHHVQMLAPGDTAISALIVDEWTGTDWVSITGNIDSDAEAPAVFSFDDDGSGTADLGNNAYSSTLNDEM